MFEPVRNLAEYPDIGCSETGVLRVPGETYYFYLRMERRRNGGYTEQNNVRFRFKNLSAAANRRLSLIPIPLIVAQPGFRSKTWLLGQHSGDFIGYYEFDSVETAEAYWYSLPLKMMRGRAAADSLTHKINAMQPNRTKEG